MLMVDVPLGTDTFYQDHLQPSTFVFIIIAQNNNFILVHNNHL